ncbi:hypothetical protein R1flu_015806 [Riccia fluitans]|uniref:Uncharacterized protein n=1 Tax=Riccia fluitans TaxID=41844 RepID=A0ABD1YKV4_9MARC
MWIQMTPDLISHVKSTNANAPMIRDGSKLSKAELALTVRRDGGKLKATTAQILSQTRVDEAKLRSRTRNLRVPSSRMPQCISLPRPRSRVLVRSCYDFMGRVAAPAPSIIRAEEPLAEALIVMIWRETGFRGPSGFRYPSHPLCRGFWTLLQRTCRHISLPVLRRLGLHSNPFDPHLLLPPFLIRLFRQPPCALTSSSLVVPSHLASFGCFGFYSCVAGC